jgi:hypothetical protein
MGVFLVFGLPLTSRLFRLKVNFVPESPNAQASFPKMETGSLFFLISD